VPANIASSASREQLVGSSLSTECPTFGTTSRCEPGICAATSRAFAVGVRRSSAPLRISVGTAGSGVFCAAAVGVENGQKVHAGMSLKSSTSARVNGATAPAGSAAIRAFASARRRRGLEERFHGNCSSSQLVA
jgi:hypothetical protein